MYRTNCLCAFKLYVQRTVVRVVYDQICQRYPLTNIQIYEVFCYLPLKYLLAPKYSGDEMNFVCAS